MGGAENSKISIEVSHDLCAGVAMCIQMAPGAFSLDDLGQSVFQPDSERTMKEIQQAADSCPMGAITIVESE